MNAPSIRPALRLASDPSVAPAAPRGDRRRPNDPRVAFVADVVLSTPAGRTFAFRTRDVSMGGLFVGVRVGEDLAVRLGVVCSVRLLTADDNIDFDAELRRLEGGTHGGPRGLGFAIVRIAPEERARLAALLVLAKSGVPPMRRRTRRRRWALLALACALAPAGWFASAPLRRPRPIAVKAGTVQVGAAHELVSSPTDGEVVAARHAPILSPLDGPRVARVAVQRGDRVTKGQVLVELDASTFDAALARTRADLRVATAQLAQARNAARIAESHVDTERTLVDKGASAPASLKTFAEQLTAADDAVRVQESAVDAARAALAAQSNGLKGRAIVAPIDGTVADLAVAAGDTLGLRQQIALVLDTSSFVVRVPFDDADAARLRAGQAAHVYLRGTKTPIAGVVATVDAIAKNDGKGHKIVYADLTIPTPPEGALRHGASANADVVVDTHERAKLVPPSAVVRRGQERIVWIVGAGSRLRARPVKTRLVNVEAAEIVEGLDGGETIVTNPGGDKLADGALAAPEPRR